MQPGGALLRGVWRGVAGFWRHPTVLVVWLLVVSVTILSGPFGTMNALSLLERIPFWAVVVTAAFFIGSITYTLRVRTIAAGVSPSLLVHVVALTTAVFAVALVVQGMVLLFFEEGQAAPPFWRIFLEALGVGVAVKLAIHFGLDPMLLTPRGERMTTAEKAPDGAVSAAACPLLSRLPPQVRGPVFHVCASDHYVRVATAKGSHMMLMRFADALKALERLDGMQVHRSHWVAREVASELKRERHRHFLYLTNGERVPVSRHRARAVRRWLARDAGGGKGPHSHSIVPGGLEVMS